MTKPKISFIQEDSDTLGAVIRRVPVDALDQLQAIGIKQDEICEVVAPRRTLQRRREEGHLSMEEGDRAATLGRLALMANRVFGDWAKALRWLRKPKTFLHGLTPMQAAHTTAGSRLVEEKLVAIDHGQF